MGATSFNVGAALRASKGREGLADRILSETAVAKMLALTTDAVTTRSFAWPTPRLPRERAYRYVRG